MPTYNLMNQQVTAESTPLNTGAGITTTGTVSPIISATNTGGVLSNVQTGATQAITADQLSPAQAITLPPVTVSTAKADSTVAGSTTATKSLQDYIKELTPPATTESTQADTLTKQLSDLIGQDTGKISATQTAEADAGVPQLKQDLNTINGEILAGQAEYNKLKAEYEKLAVENRNKPITMSSIIGNDAQIRYAQASDLNVKASEINMKIARAQALQGSIELAKETASKAVDLKYEAVEDQIKVKTAQLQLLQPILDKQEKIQAQALDRQYKEQQAKIEEDKAKQKINLSLALDAGIKTRYVNRNGEFFDSVSGEAFSTPQDFFKASGVNSFEEAYQKGLITDYSPELTATKDFAKQAQSKYPDVYIPLNSSPEQVAQIVKSSRIYQDQVRGPVGNVGSSSVGLASSNIIDANTDAGVKAIIASNIKNGYGNAYNAVKAKYGEAVANSYDKVYQDVFNKGASVEGAFNNLKLGNNSVPQEYQGLLDVILGSDKLTKDQKASITNSIKTGQDPLAVIKNKAKDMMGQTNATKLDNYETAKTQLTDIQSALNAYYSAGGSTNLFKGNYEKVINKLGEVKDPRLVELATQIQGALQQYRNAVSGTAYSVQEGNDIASIFPGINKTQGLNNAIIKGRMSAFDSTIDSMYRSALGSGYDTLKNNQSGGSGGTTILTGPDGLQYQVPNDQVNAFLQAGGKR